MRDRIKEWEELQREMHRLLLILCICPLGIITWIQSFDTCVYTSAVWITSLPCLTAFSIKLKIVNIWRSTEKLYVYGRWNSNDEKELALQDNYSQIKTTIMHLGLSINGGLSNSTNGWVCKCLLESKSGIKGCLQN